MKRLITFGCSLTYGYGLLDCYIEGGPGKVPSLLGWPSTVARHLGRECVNMSKPGVSNKFIWNRVVNFEFNSSDIVIIHWTYTNRSCIFRKDGIENIGTWTGHDEYYDKFYDDHDATVMSRLYLNHVNNFLETEDIEVHNIITNSKDLNLLNFKNEMVSSHIPLYISELKNDYPLAEDNHHPGIECNLQCSKVILDHLHVDHDIPYQIPLGTLGKVKRRLQYLRNK